VLYVAAEGGFGIERRLTAFRLHLGIDAADVPFFILTTAPDLCDPEADTEDLLAEIKHLAPSVGLIVLDTLSRVMAGGNENASDDMGALVRNCDRIREETGAHVMLVHHTGKDAAKGARGHSLLRAATDTEIEVKRDPQTKIITATMTKQRDGEVGQVYGFRLDPVEIGEDQDGDPITSCVIEPVEVDNMRGKTQGTKLTSDQELLMREIQNMAIDERHTSGEHYRLPLKAVVQRALVVGIDSNGKDRKRPYAVLKRLQVKGLIEREDESIILRKSYLVPISD
jgi:hypothetical protein